MRGHDELAEMSRLIHEHRHEALHVRRINRGDNIIEDDNDTEDWDADTETTETTVTFSSIQNTIERDVDDDDEDEG